MNKNKLIIHLSKTLQKNIVWRGGEGSDWVSPSKEFASQYGKLTKYELSSNAKLIDAETEADEFASEYEGEGVEDSLSSTDLWYQPDKDFANFIRKKGYDGFQNGDNIFIVNKNVLKKIE